MGRALKDIFFYDAQYKYHKKYVGDILLILKKILKKYIILQLDSTPGNSPGPDTRRIDRLIVLS